jgi:hypothetical protein
MQTQKNLEELGSVPTAKIVQELQPNKTCTCGACEPRKPKRADGKRRLKVSPHLFVSQRAWVKEDSVYDYVPQIRLVGHFLMTKVNFSCSLKLPLYVTSKTTVCTIY